MLKPVNESKETEDKAVMMFFKYGERLTWDDLKSTEERSTIGAITYHGYYKIVGGKGGRMAMHPNTTISIHTEYVLTKKLQKLLDKRSGLTKT